MRYFVGIDLGGTNIAAGLTDENGALLRQCSVPTGAQRPMEAILDDMARAALDCVKAGGLKPEDITALGVGVPGAVNDDTGMVLFAPNLNCSNVAMAEGLRQRTGIPNVHLANDADCAALGEMVAGDAAAYNSGVMITIGTGIGGGLIHNGKVFAGWTGSGTEPGHIPLVLGGVPCGCGKRGCFETYASATALIRQTREAMQADSGSKLWQVAGTLDAVTAKTPFDAALLGDETAKRVLDQYIEYLAAGIGGIVNLFRPEVIILGGGVSNQGEVLLAPLREKLKEHCYASESIAPPKVVRAALGNDAGIIGAALLGK